MRLIWGFEEQIGSYLSSKFPQLVQAGDYRPHAAVAFFDDAGDMQGAAGLRFDSPWEGQLSICAETPRFLSRGNLREMFGMCFGPFGVVRLTCNVAKGNRKARRFVERLGFVLEGVKLRAFDGKQSSCVYGMVADRCPWTGKEVDDAANRT